MGRPDGDLTSPLGADKLRFAAKHALREQHVRLASDIERRALMQLGRLDVQNALTTVGCRAASLLDDEPQRVRLVEQAELSPRRLAVRRIREDSAAEQVAMEVRDERSHVT